MTTPCRRCASGYSSSNRADSHSASEEGKEKKAITSKQHQWQRANELAFVRARACIPRRLSSIAGGLKTSFIAGYAAGNDACTW